MTTCERYAGFYSNNPYSEEENMILAPSFHLDIATNPEEKFMMKVLTAVNQWLKVPEKKKKEIFDFAEMMYCRESLVDDIRDGTEVRNGIKVSHMVYGLSRTMNTISYMNFVMVQKLLNSEKPLEGLKIHTEQTLEYLKGQAMELHWFDNNVVPTIEEYINACCRKAGPIMANGILLMQLYSNNKTDLTKLIKSLGLYWQLYNDYINYASEKYMAVTGFCADITEGKISLPIIHAIYSKPDDDRILNILKLRTNDEKLKKECLSLIKECGSIEYTKRMVLQVKTEILDIIEEIGENPLLVQAVEEHYKSFLD